MSDSKRLRIDIPAAVVPFNTTSPTTPGPTVSTPPVSLVNISPTAATCMRRGGRNNQLTPEQKVQLILQRHDQSFCEELKIPIQQNTPSALWQWFCTSVLLSARIKSNAGLAACQALFQAGLTSPLALQCTTKEDCSRILRENGYERYDEKTAGFLVDDARAILEQYGGDLNILRDSAGRNPAQERVLLKKYKGVGDGGVDIFFREVQLVWHELFPFADKKALKAARLVGLREHPQSLAELCGNDKLKYVRLIAALVRIELSKTFNEY